MAADNCTRRDFLRVAAGGAAVAAIGTACGSGSDNRQPSAAAPKDGASNRTLRIIQSTHFVPAYDIWFDDYARRWGEQHDVKVAVDHIPIGDLFGRAEAEAAARRGHDMLAFFGAGAAVVVVDGQRP